MSHPIQMPVDYSNRRIFTDEKLLKERELLNEEIKKKVNDFLEGIIDDYEHLRQIEEEAIKRGHNIKKSPIPFIAAMPYVE